MIIKVTTTIYEAVTPYPAQSEPVESLEEQWKEEVESIGGELIGKDGDHWLVPAWELPGILQNIVAREKQKARIDELEKIVGEAVSAIYQSDDGVGWAVPAGTIYDRLKELREEHRK